MNSRTIVRSNEVDVNGHSSVVQMSSVKATRKLVGTCSIPAPAAQCASASELRTSIEVIHTNGSMKMLDNGRSTAALVNTARLSKGITTGLMSTPATATEEKATIDGNAVPTVAAALNESV